MNKKLWRSGIIFTALSLIVGIGNFIFLGIINLRFPSSEVGLANFAAPFIMLLGLPVQIAITAVVHHIAHFRGSNEEARLQGLLVGCRRFLAKLTVAGCIAAALFIQPLSAFFAVPRATLTLAALVSLIIGLWGAYATALCQGMAWFKRLALIALAGVALKLGFVWFATEYRAIAEISVLAIGIGTLANFAVFFWWRDLFRSEERISPWNQAFFRYLVIAAAGVTAQNLFLQGDVLAAKRYLPADLYGAYTNTNRVSLALHLAVSPLLTVLFTARSSERSAASIRGPFGLLALYAAGLMVGALVLFLARDLCFRLLNVSAPEARAMLAPLAITMIFVGLNQALGMWAMASNWMRITILYGFLGVAYWGVLLRFGKSASTLLAIMPVAAGICFVIIFSAWFLALRAQRAQPRAP